MKIRDYYDKDFIKIKELIESYYNEAGREKSDFYTELNDWVNKEDIIVLVSEYTYELIGFLTGKRIENELVILDIYVVEEHRGRGIATSLIKKLVKKAKQSGYKRILTHPENKASEELVQKLGFKKTKEAIKYDYALKI